MSFWEQFGFGYDDQFSEIDKSKGNEIWGNSGMETVEARTEMRDSVSNLPQGEIQDTEGICQTCGKSVEDEIRLGNGLCMACWDYVVEKLDWNTKIFPDVPQYKAILNR